MENLPNTQTLIRDPELAQYAQALYEFFTEAEVNGTHFTYAKIGKYFRRSPSTIGKYVRNYWSWFLRKEPKQGRANILSCQGLRGYPEFYFVMAHQRNQGQYYRHFSEALLKAEERAEARRAKLQGEPSTPLPPASLPNVPGQDLPEVLHIEDLPLDEEGDEIELETIDAEEREQPQDLEGITAQEPQEGDDETAFGSARKERIDLMSLLTLDKQLERMRKEIMDELSKMRGSIVDQVRAELAPSIQALGQTLTAEMQGLPVPLADQTFVTRIQALEQTLLEQIQSSHTPPDFSSVTARIQAMEQTLLAEVHTPPDLSSVHAQLVSSLQTLEQAIRVDIQRIYSLPALSQVGESIEQLQQQIDAVFSSVSQISPISARLGHLQSAMDALSSQLSQPSTLPGTLQELQGQVSELSKQFSQSLAPDLVEQLQQRLAQRSEVEQTALRDSIKALEQAVRALECNYSEIAQQLRSTSEPSQISTNLKEMQAEIVNQFSSLSKQMSDLDWLIARITPDELERIYGFIRSGVNTSFTLIKALHDKHEDFIHKHFLSAQETRQQFFEGQEEMQQEAEKIQQILFHKKQISLENVVEQQSLPESTEHQSENEAPSQPIDE
jgi:hypothetical protein